MRNILRPSGSTQPQWVSWLQLVLLLRLWTCLQAQLLKTTRWPLYSGKPLLLAWNAPTEDCRPRHEIIFQLDQFQIVASPNEGFTKQNLTIFYQDRLGLYPYYGPGSTAVNGGLPQAASLMQHLEKMPEGLQKYIKDPTAKGLAVIDWEEWRPLWIRNWGTKDIYRERSRRSVSEKNPTWSQDQVAKVAQQEFELSAQTFMLETLRLAKSLRPNQLWGFYLFPDCYNHNYQSNLENYTGRCPDVEMTRNDQLKWLWMESMALFPSIYMVKLLKDKQSGRQFVRNRVKEGMRLASVGDGPARPVFVYTRPTYASAIPTSNGSLPELLMLSEMDLVSTIGESVALGVAGVILWGDSTYASSHASCSSLNEYLRGPLGRYLLNVTSAAEQCSRNLCEFRGRCLRKQPDMDTYLHLSPNTHSIERQGNTLKVIGQMGAEEISQLKEDFQCQCYNGYMGDRCSQGHPGNRGIVLWTTWLQVLLLPLVLMGFLH
ncbi:hyaluronidase-2-like [Myxocyprinus asiaticus]|uniref:hyaluronidase-2-like n=1 Tax=Myxocyprinus asiaticus TaxID=70543 RepID=UPI00222361BE|nr:hyaluronidase-2-like [Myxocyprinus asiaticus]XP_051551434.1 hyaluronidase-2-like [Myxocyprinus asiaticus]XP_051551435.1 hyaluronidase-2-like [Myxocyprinus asiaticus]